MATLMALCEGIKRLNIPHQSPRQSSRHSPFLVGRGPGGRSEKVKPEFTVNPGFTFFVFRRSACRAKVGGEDEEIGESNLAIAIEIAPGVISLLTEPRSELIRKGQEVGEIHIAIAIEVGRGE